jgi:hypothetical protein
VKVDNSVEPALAKNKVGLGIGVGNICLGPIGVIGTSSFAREIDQNGIDGLVKALSDRNKQLAASSGNS